MSTDPLEPPPSRAFGVGIAKSGTHTLATLTAPLSEHEPDAEALLRLVLKRADGGLDRATFESLLRQLIERRNVGFNVSQINGFVIESLVRLYPSARHILTVRDAGSWLRSIVNHQITIGLAATSAWQAFRDLRFATPPTSPHREDMTLQLRGLYPVDAYLKYWRRHIAGVVLAVAREQLLVVATAELDASLPEILTFLNRPDLLKMPKPSRSFAGRYVPSPLDELDQAWLMTRVDHHTAQLLATLGDRLSPDIIAALTPQQRTGGSAR